MKTSNNVCLTYKGINLDVTRMSKKTINIDHKIADYKTYLNIIAKY